MHAHCCLPLGDDGRRFHEFVVFPARIGHLQAEGGAGRLVFRPPQCQHVVGHLDPVPAAIPVHRVVTADDVGDAAAFDAVHLVLQASQVGVRTPGRGIAAIEKGMKVDPAQAGSRHQVQQRVDVVFVAVHAAVGQEAEDVQRGIGRLDLGDHVEKGAILGEMAIAYRTVDAREVLIDDAARADIEVADFRVAHLPGGQAHGGLRSLDQRMRTVVPEMVEIRLAGTADRVVRISLAASETIEDE